MIPLGTVLVGAGIVGRAILKAHIDADLCVVLADQNGDAVRAATRELVLDEHWTVRPIDFSGGLLAAVSIRRIGAAPPQANLVIESIAERLDVKQTFFIRAESLFGPHAILCSNTSILRINEIASTLNVPSRFAGMHFFMPVEDRPAVEIIRGSETSQQTIDHCEEHVKRLGKQPLIVADSPGFIVNRLLSPYLNQAMLLFCGGVSASRIEQAALTYGMPISPLELIDYIGLRTMFDAGRVYWQSFPNRIDPAPILGKLIKQSRLGRSAGAGFYDYVNGQRSADVSAEVKKLVETYRRPMDVASDEDLVHLLAIPMWIEATIAQQDGTVTSVEQFDIAMRGGLGYASDLSWRDFFHSLGNSNIDRACERWKAQFKSMNQNGVKI